MHPAALGLNGIRFFQKIHQLPALEHPLRAVPQDEIALLVLAKVTELLQADSGII